MGKSADIGMILERAVKEKVSDIIITAGSPPVLCINGRMMRYGTDSLSPEQTQEMIYAVLDSNQAAIVERDRELDFSFTFKENFRFRANVFWQRGSVGAAFRLLSNDIPSMEALGLPPMLKEFADLKQGLILVTGPTGHGKSTTLASMIDYINRTRANHIITIEDPIEFVHSNRCSVVEQREVGMDTHSFAAGVRHVLRQAPHIVMVGEMRDLETISTTLTAAETGHLVFATLHTNDCPQAIDRIIDVFPPAQQSQIRVQLSMCLKGVLAQRLLPKKDGTGRIPACEIMTIPESISYLIRQGKTDKIYAIMETQAKLGMITLDAAVKTLFLSNVISEDIAKQSMRNPNALFG